MDEVSSYEGVPSIARLGMGGVFFMMGISICLEVADGRSFFLMGSSICLEVGDGRGFF